MFNKVFQNSLKQIICFGLQHEPINIIFLKLEMKNTIIETQQQQMKSKIDCFPIFLIELEMQRFISNQKEAWINKTLLHNKCVIQFPESLFFCTLLLHSLASSFRWYEICLPYLEIALFFQWLEEICNIVTHNSSYENNISSRNIWKFF